MRPVHALLESCIFLTLVLKYALWSQLRKHEISSGLPFKTYFMKVCWFFFTKPGRCKKKYGGGKKKTLYRDLLKDIILTESKYQIIAWIQYSWRVGQILTFRVNNVQTNRQTIIKPQTCPLFKSRGADDMIHLNHNQNKSLPRLKKKNFRIIQLCMRLIL